MALRTPAQQETSSAARSTAAFSAVMAAGHGHGSALAPLGGRGHGSALAPLGGRGHGHGHGHGHGPRYRLR